MTGSMSYYRETSLKVLLYYSHCLTNELALTSKLRSVSSWRTPQLTKVVLNKLYENEALEPNSS